MKKTLAMLLAMVMVISCLSGLSFNVFAEGAQDAEAVTFNLYKGEGSGGNVYHWNMNAKSFGQRFTVSSDSTVVSITIKSMATFGDGNVNKGTFKVYQWQGSYENTVAATPLFESAIENHKDNTELHTDIPEELGITGEIYYEITYLEGSGIYAPYNGAGGAADGVECYRAGKPFVGEGTGGIYSAVTLKGGTPSLGGDEEIPPEEVIPTTTIDLCAGGVGDNQFNWKKNMPIGQRFTVPAGKILIDVHVGKLWTHGDGSDNTGRFDLYRWKGDYAASVEAEPLYTQDIVNHKDGAEFVAKIPAELAVTGEVIYVLTYLSGSGTFGPQNAAKGNAEGVSCYRNGEEFAGEIGNFVGFGIWAWMSVADGEGGEVTPPVDGEETLPEGGEVTPPPEDEDPITVIDLFAGEKGDNQYNWAKNATIGQYFRVPVGGRLKNITVGKLYTGGDGSANTGKLEVYQWNTDYATTVGGDALYAVDIINHVDGQALSVDIPSDIEITGKVLYVLTYLSGDGMWMPMNASKGAAEGVINYRNGQEFIGERGNNVGTGIWSWITVAGELTGEMPDDGEDTMEPTPEAETFPLYAGEGAGDNVYHWDMGVKSFGQKFTVPSGKYMTGLAIHSLATFDDGNDNKGTFKVYQWQGDYNSTVASAPLFESTFEDHINNTKYSVSIPVENEVWGEVFYEITYIEGSKIFAPFNAAGGAAEGVVCYRGASPFAGEGLGGIYSWITVEDGAPVVEPPEDGETTVPDAETTTPDEPEGPDVPDGPAAVTDLSKISYFSADAYETGAYKGLFKTPLRTDISYTADNALRLASKNWSAGSSVEASVIFNYADLARRMSNLTPVAPANGKYVAIKANIASALIAEGYSFRLGAQSDTNNNVNYVAAVDAPVASDDAQWLIFDLSKVSGWAEAGAISAFTINWAKTTATEANLNAYVDIYEIALFATLDDARAYTGSGVSGGDETTTAPDEDDVTTDTPTEETTASPVEDTTAEGAAVEGTAADGTAAGTGVDDDSTEAPAEGCKAVVGSMSAIALIAVASAAAVALKKKED